MSMEKVTTTSGMSSELMVKADNYFRSLNVPN